MAKQAKTRTRFLPFFIGMIIGLIGLTIIIAWSYAYAFTRESGMTLGKLIATLQNSANKRSEFQNKTVTFLILGLDQREDALETTLLTDTIMLASLNIENNALTLLPLPRDLYLPDLQTKINALYFYGSNDQKQPPAEYVNATLSEITGIKPDYWIVINYHDLPDLIDQLGGVSVNVKSSFSDSQYPNPDFITGASTESYMTVSFEQGETQMDGERALAFIRSRKSESDEGTDIARSERQMLLIQAIAHKLQGPGLLFNPEKLGSLYALWKSTVATNMSDSEALAIASLLHPPTLSIASKNIPVDWQEGQPPVLVNPPATKYGLSVWEPYEEDWEQLKGFIMVSLK